MTLKGICCEIGAHCNQFQIKLLNKLKWQIILGLNCLLWGSNYIVTKSLLDSYETFSIVVFRVLTATLGLFLFSLIIKAPPQKRLHKSDYFWLSISSLTGVIFTSVFFILSIEFVNVSLSSILTNTNTLFVAIFAMVIGLEKPSRNKFLGIIIGLVGLSLVVLRDQNFAEVLASSEIKGILFGILAAISNSVFTIIGKAKLIPKIGGLRFTFYSLIPSCLVLVLVALFFYPRSLKIHASIDLLKIAYMGLITTALVWVIFHKSMHHMQASRATIFKLLIPPSAAVLSFFFFGEKLPLQFYIGMAIVLIGLYFVNMKNKALDLSP